MSSFNKLIILGNLTRSVEGKELGTDGFVASFGVAVNRRYKTAAGEQREEVTFLDCSAFGKIGRVIAEHFDKGKPILLDGRIKQENWEDRNGGGKRSRHVMVVEGFSFVGGRDGADGDDSTQRQSAPSRPSPSQRPQRQATAEPVYNGEAIPEDQIPFAISGRDTQPL